jgi:hypothetical protein
MGQSAEELRRDIERTRGELTGTVDAIGDRVSPGRIVERRTNRARQGFRSMREAVMGTASDAAGAVGGGVTGAAGAVGDRVSGVGSSVSNVAGDAAGTLKEAPHMMKEAAARRTKGAPLVAGLVAFGAGALVASLVKGSETEGRVAQTVLDSAQPIKEAATEVGQQLASGLKDQGQQAVQQVVETASQAGQEVRDQAQQATQQTVDTSRDATQELKTQAQQAGQQVAEQASSSTQAVRSQL